MEKLKVFIHLWGFVQKYSPQKYEKWVWWKVESYVKKLADSYEYTRRIEDHNLLVNGFKERPI